MRRLFLAGCAGLLVLSLLPPVSSADGLYVGHGRRSAAPREFPWAARLNLGGGFHGARNPLDDSLYGRSSTWHSFGGYGNAGLELYLGHHNSLETYFLYRKIDRTDVFRVLPFASNPQTILSEYRNEALSLGGTIRHYFPAPSRRSAGYFGFGGGYLRSDSRVLEVVNGEETVRLDSEDEGPEAHFLVGWEGQLGIGLTLGLELGYRHTWLAKPDDFSGFVVGARLGVLMGE